MRKLGTTLIVIIACSTFIASRADTRPAEKAPAVPPKISIGRDTTYFSEPLDAAGEVDFETALNERLRGKITPDENAQVLLIQVLGPAPEGGDPLPDEFFRWLGIPPLPMTGDYFIRLHHFQPNGRPLPAGESQKLYDQRDLAAKAPWTIADYPLLAAWLQANEKQLANVLEATRRPHHFNPLVPPEKQGPRDCLTAALLPHVQVNRELVRTLAARAMLRMGQRLPDEAWDDLLAAHRLGRLVSQGSTLIELLSGVAIERMIAQTDQAYLAHCRLSSRQLRRRLHDLQRLSDFGGVSDKNDLTERLLFIDTARVIRQGNPASLEWHFGNKPQPLNAADKQKLAALDWNLILHSGNRWYDRLVAAQNIPDRDARRAALTGLQGELSALKGSPIAQKDLRNFLLHEDTGRNPSQGLSDRLVHLMINGVAVSAHNYRDRGVQSANNLQIAFALAMYRSDHKRDPDQLSELVPDYLPQVPNDLFSGKPLAYRASGDGFIFYSVGPNEKDEAGRGYDDKPVGDDLSFRIGKLPPLAK